MSEIQKHEELKDEVLAGIWIVLGMFLFFVAAGTFIVIATAWN